MKKEILSENSAALLNKKITDVAKSNPSEDMWFIKAPGWEGFYLEDEERDGNFSYWHLYDKDDEHKGTVSIENGVITQLPRNLSESKTIKKKLLSEETKRMKHLAGIIKENENLAPSEQGYQDSNSYSFKKPERSSKLSGNIFTYLDAPTDRTKAVIVYFKDNSDAQEQNITYTIPMMGESVLKLALDKFDKEFGMSDFYVTKVALAEEA